MLKTNSKAVKTAIREFIAAGAIDWALSANEYDRENGYEPMAEAVELEKLSSKGEENADVQKAAAALVWKCFQNDTEGDYRLGHEPMQSIFDSWVRGLPGVVGSEDFLFCNAVDFMAGILQESEAEKAKYGESDAEELAIYLIWREVSRLARGL